MNFAAGIGAGIAAGIAIGLAAGRKKAGDDLQKYIERNRIAIQNGYGEVISTDQFVTEALNTTLEKNRKIILAISFVLGLLILMGIVTFLFVATG
jgi:hypothetical protein